MTQDDDHHDKLAQFHTYGWEPDISLSDDDNMMDLVLLVTRASKLKQGSMACILLGPLEGSSEEKSQSGTLLDRIFSIANNQALYKRGNSDVHAEIVAIGQAARNGLSTNQATAYITMPPCKNCFAALISAGIKRIVSIHRPPAFYSKVLERVGVEMVQVENLFENRLRVERLVSAHADLSTAE